MRALTWLAVALTLGGCVGSQIEGKVVAQVLTEVTPASIPAGETATVRCVALGDDGAEVTDAVTEFTVTPTEGLAVDGTALTGQIVGFVIFLIAALAELSRTPFDMPIAESELVMGYLTEYSGLRFTMFFLGEYAGMVSLAAIAATLFLGGWYFPFVDEEALNFLGPLVIGGKVALLVFLFIWMRWTFPRLR